MFSSTSKIKLNDQSGIALVLSVLILSNLFMITLVVSDVILRITRTSREVRDSEIAYMAAETSIEKAIYSIEKARDASGLGVPLSVTAGSMSTSDATWERYIEPNLYITLTCLNADNETSFPAWENITELETNIDADSSCIFAENFDQGPLGGDDPLNVILAPGHSFELEYDINVPSTIDFYPNQLDITWSGSPSGYIVALVNGVQSVVNTIERNSIKYPSTGSFSQDPNHIIRIINNDSEHVLYRIAPHSSGDIPIGISINAKGFYGNSNDVKERNIVVDRRFWQIY